MYHAHTLTAPLFTQTSPFVMRRQTENGTEYEGYAIDVLDLLARRLGVSYVIHEPHDGLYGTRLPNGSWTGMIGEVIRGVSEGGREGAWESLERQGWRKEQGTPGSAALPVLEVWSGVYVCTYVCMWL